MSPGQHLLIDDGRLRLEITGCSDGHIAATVLVGGPIGDRKGVNLPGAVLPVSAMTEKDRKDLSFALDQGVDWVALSFVQRPDDVAELRTLVGSRASVLAKIEKPAALDNLAQIVDLSDAIMVARGDLGVELLPEEVPSIQKADRAGLPGGGQAGDRGDSDAGVDGCRADADPGRSLRRRQRGV